MYQIMQDEQLIIEHDIDVSYTTLWIVQSFLLTLVSKLYSIKVVLCVWNKDYYSFDQDNSDLIFKPNVYVLW